MVPEPTQPPPRPEGLGARLLNLQSWLEPGFTPYLLTLGKSLNLYGLMSLLVKADAKTLLARVPPQSN